MYKQTRYTTAAIAVITAVVIGAPMGARGATSPATGHKCIQVEKNGGYLWKCWYRHKVTKRFTGGSVSAGVGVGVGVGIWVSQPAAPPPVPPPGPPVPPPPPPPSVVHTVTVIDHNGDVKTEFTRSTPPSAEELAAQFGPGNLTGSGTNWVYTLNAPPVVVESVHENTREGFAQPFIFAVHSGFSGGAHMYNVYSVQPDGTTAWLAWEWAGSAFDGLNPNASQEMIEAGARYLEQFEAARRTPPGGGTYHAGRLPPIQVPDGTVTVTYSDGSTAVVPAPGPAIGSPKA